MEIGDILLLGTKGERWYQPFTSKKIQKLQVGLEWKFTQYSHVALCIDDALFIEAKGKYEVQYTTYDELVKKGDNGETKYVLHYRNTKLTQNDKTEITERGLYYVGTPYSKLFMQVVDYIASKVKFWKKYRPHSVKDEASSFCSSLVVDILEPLNILAIYNRNSKYILPLHIEKFVQQNDSWKCVDSVYCALGDNQERFDAYEELGKTHKIYYEQKTSALRVTRSFYTIKDYYNTIPLWFRLHIYHLIKTGTKEGDVKEYLALKSLVELLKDEK